MITKTDWDDLFKVKIRNFEESTDKHDIIKLLIMRKLVRKYQNEKKWIRVYAEHPITINKETRIADVLFQNIKTKEQYAFEIQRDYKQKWLNSIKEFYKDWDKCLSNMFFKTSDVITIPLDEILADKKLTFNELVKELNKELDKYII